MNGRNWFGIGGILVCLLTSGRLWASSYACDVDTLGGVPFAPLGGLLASNTGYGAGVMGLDFQQETVFNGNFLRTDGAGNTQTVLLSGRVPRIVRGVETERFGSIDVVADVTADFQGAYSPDDTRIVVDFSRPEVPEETFAGMVEVRAAFADGTSAVLCMGPASGCNTLQTPLSCQTITYFR